VCLEGRAWLKLISVSFSEKYAFKPAHPKSLFSEFLLQAIFKYKGIAKLISSPRESSSLIILLQYKAGCLEAISFNSSDDIVGILDVRLFIMYRQTDRTPKIKTRDAMPAIISNVLIICSFIYYQDESHENIWIPAFAGMTESNG
jgi:hypothetical protein